MQFNIIFKTIFEYIHDKFCFVHTCTNTFCKYRKKLLASPRVHLVTHCSHTYQFYDIAADCKIVVQICNPTLFFFYLFVFFRKEGS